MLRAAYQVRSGVLTMSILTQSVSASTLEVDRGRVEEHQVDFTEQITASIKQSFLNPIFDTAWTAQDLLAFGQGLAQKRHGSIEMVQLQILGPWNPILLSPTLRRPITAGS